MGARVFADVSTSGVVQKQLTAPQSEITLGLVSVPEASTLVASQHDSPDTALEVLEFSLNDPGVDTYNSWLTNIKFNIHYTNASLEEQNQMQDVLKGRLCFDNARPCLRGNPNTSILYEVSGSDRTVLESINRFGRYPIPDGTSLNLRLELYLESGSSVPDAAVQFRVSVATSGVTFDSSFGGDIDPRQPAVDSNSIGVNVVADRLRLLPPGVSGSSTIIRTYGPGIPDGGPNAEVLKLVFEPVDEHGNRDLHTEFRVPWSQSEIEISVNGNELLISTDANSLSSDSGLYTLQAVRATGGGAEGAADVRLSIMPVSTTTLFHSETVPGFMVDVIGNTLEEDSINFQGALISGQQGALEFRYRLWGCDIAERLDIRCQEDSTHPGVRVSVEGLMMTCAACSTPDPTFPASLPLMSDSSDPSLFVHEESFTVPTLADPASPVDLVASGMVALESTPESGVDHEIMLSQSSPIIGDTQAPAAPMDFNVMVDGPYQISFAWDAAMDTRVAADDPFPLLNADAYTVLYRQQDSGACSVDPNDYQDLAFTAGGSSAPADVSASTPSFAATVVDHLGSDTQPVQAATGYCFLLRVTDSARQSALAAPVSVMTDEYSRQADASGLPEDLAALCGQPCMNADASLDADGDGINNVLDTYLGGTSEDVYHSNNGDTGDIPDVVELFYGAPDRVSVAAMTVVCDAIAWQTPATSCEGIDAGMLLHIIMDADGRGVYQGADGGLIDDTNVINENTYLGSGTHWLSHIPSPGAPTAIRLEIRPLLSLDGPPEIAIVPPAGLNSAHAYSARLRLQGPLPRSRSRISVDWEVSGKPTDTTLSASSGLARLDTDAQMVPINLTLEISSTAEEGELLVLAAEVTAGSKSASVYSFTEGDHLQSLESTLRLLENVPDAQTLAFTPYLVDSGISTLRIFSLSASAPSTNLLFRFIPAAGIDDVAYLCSVFPDGTSLQGMIGGSLTGLLATTFDFTVPEQPVPVVIAFHSTTPTACTARDTLLGETSFLLFPADSGDADRNGNLIPDSQEDSVPGDAFASGYQGLRYELDGQAYYLRSPGLGLRLGDQAAGAGSGSPNLLDTVAEAADLAPPVPDALVLVAPVALDFEAYCPGAPGCMANGALVQFVFQVSDEIPVEVQYYKPTVIDAGMGWCPMTADYSDNPLRPLPMASLGCPDPHQAGVRDGLGFAAPDGNGVCPAAGSEAYDVADGPGTYLDNPQPGDRCVQISITNNGPNDSDDIADSVADPGFLATERSGDPGIEVFVDRFGGGGGSWGLPALLLLGLLTVLSLLLRMRRDAVAGLATRSSLCAAIAVPWCAALLLAVVPAQAQEPPWLPSAISLDGGVSFLDPDTDSAFEVDDDQDQGWRLGMEWLWRENVQPLGSDLFVEMSYADLGEARVCADSGCQDGDFGVDYGVWNLGVRSVWKDWSYLSVPGLGKPFASLGYRYGRAEERVVESNGVYWNAGVEWDLGRTQGDRGFSLRVFYEAYDSDASAVWAGFAWQPRLERRTTATKPRRKIRRPERQTRAEQRRERAEQRRSAERKRERSAERRPAPPAAVGQCPVSPEDACACLEPVGRSPAGWYVQVAAYARRVQAREMSARLEREGMRRVGLRTLSGSRGVVHAVRIASPRTCSAAMSIKDRVDAMLNVDSLVRPWYDDPW